MNVQELNKVNAEIMSKLKELSKGDPVKEKKIALAENIMAFTSEVVQLALLTRNKKRILKPINRKPKHKQQRRVKIFRKLMNIHRLEMQRQMILQTPIPKFPKGGNYSGGPAIVGESGSELIINKNGEIVKVNS